MLVGRASLKLHNAGVTACEGFGRSCSGSGSIGRVEEKKEKAEEMKRDGGGGNGGKGKMGSKALPPSPPPSSRPSSQFLSLAAHLWLAFLPDITLTPSKVESCKGISKRPWMAFVKGLRKSTYRLPGLDPVRTYLGTYIATGPLFTHDMNGIRALQFGGVEAVGIANCEAVACNHRGQFRGHPSCCEPDLNREGRRGHGRTNHTVPRFSLLTSRRQSWECKYRGQLKCPNIQCTWSAWLRLFARTRIKFAAGAWKREEREGGKIPARRPEVIWQSQIWKLRRRKRK